MLDTGSYNRNMAARAETVQPDVAKQSKDMVQPL